MFEFDENGVLPTPATYDDGYRHVLDSSYSYASSNISGLDNLISPSDGEVAMPLHEMQTSEPVAMDDDDDFDAETSTGEDDADSEAGDDGAMATDEVFPAGSVFPADPVEAYELSRVAKSRTTPERRYSPFAVSAAGRPRSNTRPPPFALPKLSSSLPKLSSSLPSSESKKCACCNCGKYAIPPCSRSTPAPRCGAMAATDSACATHAVSE